jgi:hypothetical protein
MSFIKCLRGLGKHSIRDLQSYQTFLDVRLNSFHISSDQSEKGVLPSVRRGELSNIVCNVFTLCRRFLFRRRQAEPSTNSLLNFCRKKERRICHEVSSPTSNLEDENPAGYVRFCRMILRKNCDHLPLVD